jgi:hypothetical protein
VNRPAARSSVILEKGNYEHLCLPSEFEPGRRSVTSIGWQDPRTEEGELLFPAQLGDIVRSTGPKSIWARWGTRVSTSNARRRF